MEASLRLAEFKATWRAQMRAKYAGVAELLEERGWLDPCLLWTLEGQSEEEVAAIMSDVIGYPFAEEHLEEIVDMVAGSAGAAALATRMTLKELSQGIVISKVEEAKKGEIGELFTVRTTSRGRLRRLRRLRLRRRNPARQSWGRRFRSGRVSRG